jgi:hypothetical protein
LIQSTLMRLFKPAHSFAVAPLLALYAASAVEFTAATTCAARAGKPSAGKPRAGIR